MLEMRGICKSYPGVRALDHVDLDLAAGEVLALLGENGAGKSTLLKILGGAVTADEGTLSVGGSPVTIHNPSDADRLGIAVIYQEFNLLPHRSVRENLFLGIPKSRYGWIQHSAERDEAKRILAELDCHIDPETICGRLGAAEQQIVEIGKALLRNAKILVMDEPTAVLSVTETECLLRLIQTLKSRGIGIIYVTHRLDEVARIADRIQILRDGKQVAVNSAGAMNRREIVSKMAGRALEQEFPQRKVTRGDVLLSVRGLSRAGAVRDVSFDLHRGEMLVLTGLIGSGRTETARLLFGADRANGGEIQLNGRPQRIRNPRDAISAGIVLLTEDRKRQGLVLRRSNLDNFLLPNLPFLSRGGWVQSSATATRYEHYRERLRLRSSSPLQLAKQLSGGNQQKLVLAKWLQRGGEVFIFDEPTRGIDVGARYEVYELMNELLAEGKGLIVISSDLPEVLGLADRILVMRGGSIVSELVNRPDLTQDDLLSRALGAHE
ncbi:MAG: sugar ABC transporter ATP-binding protein [Pirellulales bacterium]